MLPVVTVIGLQVGSAAVRRRAHRDRLRLPRHGQFLGRGRSINRDYPVIQGFILFLAVIFVVVNLLVDITLRRCIDPRVRVR